MHHITPILYRVFAALLFYFAPVAPMIHAVLALCAIDWATGVWRSKLAKRDFTSYRLRKSVNKILAYILAIIAAFIMDKELLSNVQYVPSIVAAYIGFTELTSIYENLSDITGKKFLKDIAMDISDRVKQKFIKP